MPPSLFRPCTSIPPGKLERGGGRWPQVLTAQVIVGTVLGREGRDPSLGRFLQKGLDTGLASRERDASWKESSVTKNRCRTYVNSTSD